MEREPKNRFAVGSFKEEMKELPLLQRWIVYVSLFLMIMLMLQCLLIMPIILIKYGWGFDIGDGS